MNDQNQNPEPKPNTNPPLYGDLRDQRRAERMARREARWRRHAGRPSGWLLGTILILLGLVFLFQDLGLRFLTNWWALFILIPAFWSFNAAWDIYQDNGRLTRGAASSLTLGILFTALSFLFLMNLMSTLVWPVLLIVAGGALLLTSLVPR